MGIISKIRHILPRHINRSLYSTLAEPYISYCNLVWAQPNKTELLNTILKIQKKYIRLITFSDFKARDSKPLFIDLNILSIYDMYKFQLAIYMCKIMKNLIPPLSHQHFIVNSTLHSYNTTYTRNKDNNNIYILNTVEPSLDKAL